MLLSMNTPGASIQKQVLAVLLLLSLFSPMQETKADPSDYDFYEIKTSQTTPPESVYVNLNRTNYIFWQAGDNVTFSEFGTFQVSNPGALRDHLEASSHWVKVLYTGRITGWGFINLHFCRMYHHFNSPSQADEISVGGGGIGAQTLDKDKVKREFGIP
jgi:hypothetical protein